MFLCITDCSIPPKSVVTCVVNSNEKTCRVLMTTAPEALPLPGALASCFVACHPARPSLVPACLRSSCIACRPFTTSCFAIELSCVCNLFRCTCLNHSPTPRDPKDMSMARALLRNTWVRCFCTSNSHDYPQYKICSWPAGWETREPTICSAHSCMRTNEKFGALFANI